MGMMLRRHHEEASIAEASSAEAVDDLPTRTVPELRGYAVEHGIDLGMAKTKAELIHAIRAHFAALPDRQDEQA